MDQTHLPKWVGTDLITVLFDSHPSVHQLPGHNEEDDKDAETSSA
jgi:hypothetical protein